MNGALEAGLGARETAVAKARDDGAFPGVPEVVGNNMKERSVGALCPAQCVPPITAS